ncbi:MAG: branched-chain amino acid ABC transporter permease [Halofilum sp. (in: g-proteobacteria)]|nr:branched-chain amino acid ABC transporter permease [Halofilum sp. (in: g-proteobacteria)]
MSCWWLLHRLTEMPFGRALRAMREGDETPLALGKNVASLRIRAMFIGGLVAGLAGVLYVHFNAFVAPNYFMPIETFLIWVMVIVGGAGNYLGAIAGTVLIQLIYNSTRFIGDYVPIDSSVLASMRMIAIGVLIILVLIYMPRGLLPERRRRYDDQRDS